MKLTKRKGKRVNSYYYDFSLARVRFRGSCYTHLKREATLYAEKIRSEKWQLFLKNQLVKKDKDIKIITKSYLKNNQEYLNSLSFERRSQMHLTIKLAIKFFKNKAINTRNIYNFLDEISIKRKIKNTTLQKYLESFKQIIIYAKKTELIGKNPMEKMDFSHIYKGKTNRTRFLSKIEYKALITSFKAKEIKDLIIFAKNSGLRLSEQLNLTWDRCFLDVKNPYVYIDKTKNNIPRKVFLPNLLVNILRKRSHLEKPFSISKGTLHDKYKKALIDAGITDFTWHDLRHSFASFAIQGWHLWQKKPMDIYILKDWLGHSSILQTQRYAHLSNDTLAKEIAT